MTVCSRALGAAVVVGVLALGSVRPVQAGQNPYEGVLSSATCSPGVAFTAISMGWDLGYLYTRISDLAMVLLPIRVVATP